MAKFKTRARTLDMLGRQQIASIPTAISELFKNAHDAYAERVEVDFFRSDLLFILRDDGIGMTREDFESRWLTLGTESKLDAGIGLGPPPIPADQAIRPIMGEKGIGRLAIGAIGRQLLILTRAKRGEELQDLVAAFIHWGIFECPGIDLDQIEIPIRTFPGGSLPDQADIAEMVDAFAQNVENLSQHVELSSKDELLKELSSFQVDPQEIDSDLDGPSLSGDGHGTHFFILPADESLRANIDENKDSDDKASPLQKMLIGFTNTMTPDHNKPRIIARFRDFKTDEAHEELIAESSFFSPEEFEDADHHFQGRFDEFGQFEGTVKIYENDPVNHVVPWRAGGRLTECGPFSINLAYVQGLERETKLPPEEWARITRKLNKIGGLYIYKDGIRILPYGDSDYDYLDVEKNRSKHYSYYYFSYRRMFGVIEIDGVNNAGLSEKAGREGFRENNAYRQFRNILKNFFLQMAADFFRDSGSQSDLFLLGREKQKRLALARDRRKKLVADKKSELSKKLINIYDQIQKDVPQQKIAEVLSTTKINLKGALQNQDSQQAVNEFLRVESTARSSLEELRRSYRVKKPSGISLSKQLNQAWEYHLIEQQRLETELFSPTAKKIEEILNEAAEKSQLIIDRRRRIEYSLNDLYSENRKLTQAKSIETRQVLEEVRNRVLGLTRESMIEVENSMREASILLNKLDITNIDEAEIVNRRMELETPIISIAQREQELLDNICEQLRSINWVKQGENIIGNSDILEAMDEELNVLQERAEADLELTQLGMAIEIINHEFSSSINSIRNNLRRLKAWADMNEGLRELYENIRASFDHLDGYLTLFTPLHRRLYRTPVEIQGRDISKFLQDLFGERLQGHGIKIQVTQSFHNLKLTGYPSTFYPVFVNLIDNAIFWLKDRSGERMIKLDEDNGALLISDTGPGILPLDREVIFELGFTRKPGGRGLGLYISRDVLKKADYSLSLDEHQSEHGATFRIEPVQ